MSGATSGMGRTEFSAQAWYQNPKKHLILGQFSNSPWTTLEAANCDMRTRRSSVLLNPAIRDEWQNGSNPCFFLSSRIVLIHGPFFRSVLS